MEQYKIEMRNGVRYFFEFTNGHLVLRHDDKEVNLSDAEIRLLLDSLVRMFIEENLNDIESHLKSTLATAFTLVFNDTRKICDTSESEHYSATLGLLVENSQTAYNLHKSGRKCNS